MKLAAIDREYAKVAKKWQKVLLKRTIAPQKAIVDEQ